MSDGVPVKVLIVNDDGQYLAGTATEWEFTDDRTRAKVFDYVGDRVAEQIELVRRAHGRVWIAVKLDPMEVYEFCDRCGCRMLSGLLRRQAVPVRRLQEHCACHGRGREVTAAHCRASNRTNMRLAKTPFSPILSSADVGS
jgi:hypothetical protein